MRWFTSWPWISYSWRSLNNLKGSRKLTIPRRIQRIARYIHWGYPRTVEFVKVYFGCRSQKWTYYYFTVSGRGYPQYLQIYVPGTYVSSIFGLQPSKTRPFPIKTRAIFGFQVYIDARCGWATQFKNDASQIGSFPFQIFWNHKLSHSFTLCTDGLSFIHWPILNLFPSKNITKSAWKTQKKTWTPPPIFEVIKLDPPQKKQR